MTHQPFPDIEQLRHIVTLIDYHFPEDKPTIDFHGTVKIHGTNGGITTYFDGEKLSKPIYQSRQVILDSSNTNNNFYNWGLEREDFWLSTFDDIVKSAKVAPNSSITIFGEWAGEGIERGCAIQKLSKRFFVFGLLVKTGDEERWLDYSLIVNTDLGIYNISHFQDYLITIDFSNPKPVEEEIAKFVNEVESCCPVSKAFGVEGTGEGIVWLGYAPLPNGSTQRIMFKTKGLKHKISETKKTVTIDPEVTASIDEFINYAVTRNRVDQAITNVLGQGVKERPMDKFKDILFWIYNDIQKEESDVLEKNNLTWKQVQGAIPSKAKELYLAL